MSELSELEVTRVLLAKYRTPAFMQRCRKYSKERRARNKARRTCINGIWHGKATHGSKCGWCWDVHKRGIAEVLRTPKFWRPRSRGR